MVAIVKPEFIRGNRGRQVQMTWRESVEYNSRSKAEKGRESSVTMDAYGRSITEEEAIQCFGGDDAKYMNAIVNPSDSMRALLEEKYGGRTEAQRAFSMAIMDRTNARDGLIFIHDHGENGWHLHLAYRDHRTQMFREHGKIQFAIDRELEILRGEGNRPIVNWNAHSSFKELRAELAKIQAEQRELGNARYREIRTAPDSEKTTIREKFNQQELELIGRRRSVELRANEERYSSRNMLGCAAHLVEIERIERRALTAISRMETRGESWNSKGDRKASWRGFAEAGKAHKQAMASLTKEERGAREKAASERDAAKDRADRRGELGTPVFQAEISLIDAKLEAKLQDISFRREDADARLRRSRLLVFSRGPISRGFIEWRETSRLLSIETRRIEAAKNATDQRFEIQKALGTPEHKAALAKLDERLEATRSRASERIQNAWLRDPRARLLVSMGNQSVDREKVGRAATSQVRSTLHKASRGTKTLAKSLGQAVKDTLAKARQDLRNPSKQDQFLTKSKGAQDAVRGIAMTTAKATLRTAMKAGKGTVRTAGKAAYYTGKASGRVAVGLVLALPTSGASLKAAMQGAREDLTTGAREIGKEAKKGAKETGQEAARGAKDTGKAVAKGTMAQGKHLVPKTLQATGKTALEAAKTMAGTASKALRLDLKGAALTAAAGTAKTAKEAAGTVAKTAQLPMALRLPVAVAEKIPVVGGVVSVAKNLAETTITLTKSIEFER